MNFSPATNFPIPDRVFTGPARPANPLTTALRVMKVDPTSPIIVSVEDAGAEGGAKRIASCISAASVGDEGRKYARRALPDGSVGIWRVK